MNIYANTNFSNANNIYNNNNYNYININLKKNNNSSQEFKPRNTNNNLLSYNKKIYSNLNNYNPNPYSNYIKYKNKSKLMPGFSNNQQLNKIKKEMEMLNNKIKQLNGLYYKSQEKKIKRNVQPNKFPIDNKRINYINKKSLNINNRGNKLYYGTKNLNGKINKMNEINKEYSGNDVGYSYNLQNINYNNKNNHYGQRKLSLKCL